MMSHFGFPADICFICTWGFSLYGLRALFRRLKFLRVMRDGELAMLEEFSEAFPQRAFSLLRPGAGEGMVGAGGLWPCPPGALALIPYWELTGLDSKFLLLSWISLESVRWDVAFEYNRG